MRRMVKLMFVAAIALSSAAQAQTYDVNVDVGITKTDPFAFTGSFAFNQNGTLGDVDVNDPFDHGAFTGATLTELGGGKEAVTLYDYEDHTTPSSMNFALSFDVNAPLGGPAKILDVSDVLFNIDDNFIYQCGAGRPGFTVTCMGSLSEDPVSVAKAPEIDARFAGEGLLLLAGGLLVLRGRRPQPADRPA